MNLVEVIKQYKWLVILGSILIICLIIIIFMQFSASPTPVTEDGQPEQAVSSPTPLPAVVNFSVINTQPQDNATNVYAGEQTVTITTNIPINSENELSVTFTPSLTASPIYTNTFPTRIVQIQILGGFQPNTRYSATVTNADGETIYSWNFSTSGSVGEGDSGLRAEQDRQLNENYYPLIASFPYATKDYLLGYSDRLTLKITLKRADVDRSAVLSEVRAWVQSKGVDPNSHQYVFVEL